MAGFYSSRVNASVAPVRAVQPAAGFGEALSVLGRTAGAIADQNRQTAEKVSEVEFAIAEREKARARDKASAELAVKLATSEGEHARWVTDHQNDADFERQAAARVDADMARLRGLLGGDSELEQHFAPIMARTAESRKTAAYQHHAAVVAKAGAAASEAALTALKNSAMSAPERAGEFADTIVAGIMANQSIPEALKPGVAKAAAGEVWQSGLEAAVRGGRHEAVGKALNAGTYDGILPDGAKQGLLRLVEAEGNAALVAARTAEREQDASARQAVTLVEHMVASGIDPSAADLAAAGSRARAAGLPVESFDLGVIEQRVAINRLYRGKGPIERSAAIHELQALQAAGRASAGQQVALDQLVKLNEVKRDEAAKPLKELYGQGLGGRRAAAQQMQALPLDERHALAEKVSPGLGAYVALPEATRNFALAGIDDRALVKDHLTPAKIDPAFRGAMGGAARAFSGAALDGVRETAMSIYAHFGRNEAGFNPALFKVSLNMALGARTVDGEWRGGLGDYSGKPVILPDGQSQTRFAALVSAYDFSTARDPAGQPLTKAFVTARLHPVYLGDSGDGRFARYAWENEAGHRLKDAKGDDFPMWLPN